MVLRTLAIAIAAAGLAASSGGCVTTDNSSAEPVSDMRPHNTVSEGSFARLAQTTSLRGVRVTPLEVIEDSRCPTGTQCGWEGRVVVRSEVVVAGEAEVIDLELGKLRTDRGWTMRLVEVRPDRRPDLAIREADYRFKFASR